MNEMNWGEVVRLGAGRIKDYLPLTVLVESVPTFVLNNNEDVIVVSDLHIRVRNMLRAQEKRARAGMGAPPKITAMELKEPTEETI